MDVDVRGGDAGRRPRRASALSLSSQGKSRRTVAIASRPRPSRPRTRSSVREEPPRRAVPRRGATPPRCCSGTTLFVTTRSVPVASSFLVALTSSRKYSSREITQSSLAAARWKTHSISSQTRSRVRSRDDRRPRTRRVGSTPDLRGRPRSRRVPVPQRLSPVAPGETAGPGQKNPHRRPTSLRSKSRS